MPGTKKGAAKTAKTNKLKYGDDYYVIIGSKGGKVGRGHQFAHGKVDPGVAGKLGGAKGKRIWTDEQRAAFSVSQKEAARKRKSEAANKDFQEGFDVAGRDHSNWFDRTKAKLGKVHGSDRS